MLNLESKYFYKWRKYVITKLYNEIKKNNDKIYDKILSIQYKKTYKNIIRTPYIKKLEDAMENIECNYELIDSLLFKYNILNENTK